jgi:hypothetical protein
MLARWRWRQRPGRGGIPLRGCTAQLGSGRGQDPRRLCAHAEDATAAGREDLEVEIVQSDPEGLTGLAEGVLD